MNAEVWGMTIVGAIALVAGLVLVRARFGAASGADKVLALGPVFEAVALAIFATEHFFEGRNMAPMVPHWLPWHLFWIYFVGAGLMAAAISFIAWRCVRWSASLLALFFFLVVATMDLPNLASSLHDRFFWILTARELCFGSGALVLAASVWPREGRAGMVLARVGRGIVAAVMVFYGVEHFFFPHNVPGVPLEKITPAWIPAPAAIAYFVGIVLLLAAVGLMLRPTIRVAAAGCGAVLVVLTALFYVPIFVSEFGTAQGLEGINYVGDTLLFAATVLLAGLAADRPTI